MNKKLSFLIGAVLLIIAVCFIFYALHHPQASFPWSNKLTFMIYGAYIWLILRFLIFTPFCKPQKGNLPLAFICLSMAIVFFIMEIRVEKTDLYTVFRGLVVLGGIDISIDNLYRYIKKERHSCRLQK